MLKCNLCGAEAILVSMKASRDKGEKDKYGKPKQDFWSCPHWEKHKKENQRYELIETTDEVPQSWEKEVIAKVTPETKKAEIEKNVAIGTPDSIYVATGEIVKAMINAYEFKAGSDLLTGVVVADMISKVGTELKKI